MATADEILAGAVEVASEGATQDKVLRIDNELRTISIPSAVKLLGVESDDDVNRVEFEMPRHYGEFDLSTFSVRVNYMNANGDGDIYKVVDLVANKEKMNFSWLVGRTAFMYKGDVQFVVCLKKIAEDFVVEQEFNTTVASLPVLQGLEPDEQLMQKYPDIIEQILKYMETPVSSEEIGKAVEEYLKANPIGGATINDDEVSAGSAWSSQKVSTQIDEKVSAHNTDPTAHTDVRELISGLTNRLNALADSDDTTLDQLSEIVAYIKSNKSLIDAITTSKVSVSDIVDDLVTNSSIKPLSAAQGVKLKALIDAIVPITVDSVLSSTSTNPVQNKVVLSGLNEKENKGAARSVKIGSNSYTPNESGVIDLSSMTAPDSSKLGGKSPEYYATAQSVSSLKNEMVNYRTAVNLLDNSWWKNPKEIVNQRGETSKQADWVYWIDRWLVNTTSAAAELRDGGIYLPATTSGNLRMVQRIPIERITTGQAYTLAVCESDGAIRCVSGVYNNDVISGDVTGDMGMYITLQPGGETYVYFIIDCYKNFTIRWAALYEGAYTAETLPPYVPKGYAAELAECQRHYYEIPSGTGFYGYTGSSGTVAYVYVDLPQELRVNNPSSTLDGQITMYFSGSTKVGTKINYVITHGKQIELGVAVDGAPASSPFAGYIGGGVLELSADL